MDFGDCKEPMDSCDDERGSPDGTDGPRVKRTRRKLIKSCAFCRKRKLRCDQMKPMCSTCTQRGFTTCLYPSYDAKDQICGSESTTMSSPEDDLRRKIAELENKLKEAHITEDGAERTPNPLRNLYYLQAKASGRNILYGPTATRTYLVKTNNWGFHEIWQKAKIARNQLKERTGHTMLKENCVVETPLNDITAAHVPVNFIQEACAALPSYETILEMLNHFFEDETLFEINQVLDRQKVMKDFKAAFVAGSALPLTSERPIIDLLPSAKKNYYKVAVILGVLQLVYFRAEVPPKLERLLILLTGLTTAKVMYVERLQMLFLRYHYRATFGGCPDACHFMIIANCLIQESIQMGLNRPIREVFKGQEAEVGSLESLENLWCWVLFADFDVAFNQGSNLQVFDEQIFDDDFFNDNSKTSCGLLKRFLRTVRPMVSSIYGKYKPDLEAHEDAIITFIETELPPIWFLTEAKRVDGFTAVEGKVLCHLLSMMLAFHGLRFLVYNEKTLKLKNGVLLTSMVSFTVCINMLLHAHEQDVKKFPQLVQDSVKELGPYLNRTCSMTTHLLARALSTFYGIVYYKLTLFESGLLIANPHMLEHESCDLRTLRPRPNVHVSLMGALESFRGMFDGLLNDKHFKMNVLRSHALTIFFTIERVGRVIIDKVLEYRTSAENAWISQFQKELSPGEPMEGTLMLNGVGGSVPTPELAPKLDAENPDMAFVISEDFWANYNLGLEEFMSNAEYNNLFSDFMPAD